MTDNINININLPDHHIPVALVGCPKHVIKAAQQYAEVYAREAARLNAAPVPDGWGEHYDELKATLTGSHSIMESLASMERKVGPLGSHGRGYTHKITKALRHLESLRSLLAAAPEPQGVPRSDFDAKVQEIGRARALVQEVFDMLSADHPARRLIAEKTGRWLVAFGPQGVPEPAEPTNKEKLLANALGKCILASGIVRQDIDGLSGPQLLMFAEDLCQMLAAAPEPQAAPAPEQAVPQEARDGINGPWNACMFREHCRALLAARPQQSAQGVPEPALPQVCPACKGERGYEKALSTTNYTWVKCDDCKGTGKLAAHPQQSGAAQPKQERKLISYEELVEEFQEKDNADYRSGFREGVRFAECYYGITRKESP